MSDKQLSHRQKSSLKFIEQGDPPFIQKMKARMGYRAPATVEDKFADVEEKDLEEDQTLDKNDIRNLTEEERPQIVVLNEKTDVTEEELKVEIEKMREEEDRKKIEEGKIVFRRPEKRTHTEEKSDESESKTKKTTIEQFKQIVKPNTKLLSFNEDEEDEEDDC